MRLTLSSYKKCKSISFLFIFYCRIRARKIKKKLAKEKKEIEKKRLQAAPIMLNDSSSGLPKIDVGVATEQARRSIMDEVDVSFQTKLEFQEERRNDEALEELELQKRELNHFYGSKAFQLMKNLSNQVVEKYVDIGNKSFVDPPDYPWIKEYKRFVAK